MCNKLPGFFILVLLASFRFNNDPKSDVVRASSRPTQIAVDPKVMRHLDMLGLGMEKKKIERGRKLRLYRRYVDFEAHTFIVYIRIYMTLSGYLLALALHGKTTNTRFAFSG